MNPEQDHTTCLACQGTGSAWRGSEDVGCRACAGSGLKQPRKSNTARPGYGIFVPPAKKQEATNV